MTDHFEKAIQDIATRSGKNGGPTIQDVLVALVASNDDAEARHDESLVEIEKNRKLLESHCIEADVRDKRLAVLEVWQNKWERECPGKITEAVSTAVSDGERAHHKFHEDYVRTLASVTSPPRRKNDPEETDYRERRDQARQVWLLWAIGSKVSYLLVAVATGVLVALANWLLVGRP